MEKKLALNGVEILFSSNCLKAIVTKKIATECRNREGKKAQAIRFKNLTIYA